MDKTTNSITTARFSIGELVHHKRFDYRGVIADVDARFSLSEEWYETVARSRPPKDQPWYHVLVDGGGTTYVAERHLEPDTSARRIDHPLTGQLFSAFSNGRYSRGAANNCP